MITVVVGAGPAGTAAAVTAARQGQATWLVGRPRPHPPGTLELLSGHATDALVGLGWYNAVATRATTCDVVVSRWEDDVFTERSSMLQPGGHGWIVDRSWFDPLLRRLAAGDGVTIVEAVDDAPPAHRRVLATGKHTPGGADRRILGPDQVAVTSTLPHAAIPGLTAGLLVDAAPAGWWSALDDGQRTAVTFITAIPDRTSSRERIQRIWAAAVASGPEWLPPAGAEHPPRVRPIRCRLHGAERTGTIRVGDAALSVDPLSGHGLTLALHGAARHDHGDYVTWLENRAATHERQRRAAYRTARFDTAFWRRSTT